MIIGNYDTKTDLGLIFLSQRIDTPEIKTYEAEIPSGDGKIDLTEFFGGVRFRNRNAEFVFAFRTDQLMMPIYDIRSTLHGKKLILRAEDETDWYYIGRVNVSGPEWINRTDGRIIITCDCEPYKYRVQKTVVERTIGASGALTVRLYNSRKPVIPKITTDGEITIQYGPNSHTISAGEYQITNLRLMEGYSDYNITGTLGTKIKIEYQEGAI